MKSKNPAFENSLACLQHPLTLLSIAILLLNDHVLKVVSPSWLTGKLSDFAGLFFFPIIVNGVDDHVHAFIGQKPSMALSDLVRDMKNNSSNFINEHQWVRGRFSWQEGYGAFSYSHSAIENVYNYILNQEQHHAKQTFKDEYLDFLKKFEIEHDVKYLFEWVE